MSNQASYITNVAYSRSGGTYSARMVSDYGDIYQNYTAYDSATKQASGISPSFVTNPPTVQIAIFNSKKVGQVSGSDNSVNTTGEVYPGSVVWTAIGQELTFDSKGISTNTFNGETGHFQLVNANAATNTRAGLKIIKNVVVASQATPFSIDAVASVANGKGSTKVPASLSVAIKKVSTGSVVVNITATNGGIIYAGAGGKYKTTRLTATVSSISDDTSSSGLTYEWYAQNLETGEFVIMDGEIKNYIDVGLDMVDQSRLFKVTVSAKGSAIGSDTCAVFDQSDPLRIDANPVPSDETIREGDATASQVKWTPVLMRGNDAVDDSKVEWKFRIYDSVGQTVYPQDLTDKAKFIVTEQMFGDLGSLQACIFAKTTA
jgi:hypothetical protein